MSTLKVSIASDRSDVVPDPSRPGVFVIDTATPGGTRLLLYANDSPVPFGAIAVAGVGGEVGVQLEVRRGVNLAPWPASTLLSSDATL